MAGKWKTEYKEMIFFDIIKSRNIDVGWCILNPKILAFFDLGG